MSPGPRTYRKNIPAICPLASPPVQHAATGINVNVCAEGEKGGAGLGDNRPGILPALEDDVGGVEVESDGGSQQADRLVVWPEAPQQVGQLHTGVTVVEADLYIALLYSCTLMYTNTMPYIK